MFLANKLAGAGAPEKLYVDDVFSSHIYEGNGATLNINTGVNLLSGGGLNWIKSLDSGASLKDHYMFSSALPSSAPSIGFTKANTTDASTYGSGFLGDFTSTGFQVGSLLSTSGSSYLALSFKKAKKFFDVVTYTGDGTNWRTINHSLGSTPGMIIVKRTDVAGYAPSVYHKSTTQQDYLELNTAAASVANNGYWYNTAPTDTNFSVSNYQAVNGNGGTYIAYIFADDPSEEGIIRCGSYTGNFNVDGPIINTLWEPQTIFIKRVSGGTGDWQIIDTTLGATFDGLCRRLMANTNYNANNAPTNHVGIRPNGFRILAGTAEEINMVGSNYIYMAIRRSNKPAKPSTGLMSITPGAGGLTPSLLASRKPDLLISKSRTGGDTFFVDRVRGLGLQYASESSKELKATSNSAEVSNTNVRRWTFSGGFYAISIPDAITISLARARGFFDIVGYRGDNGGQPVPHNLGVVPELAIIKSRTSARDWNVGLNPSGLVGFSTSHRGVLNSTSGLFTNTGTFSPGTATHVTPYQGDDVVAFEDYIMYLFASCPGVSKVGTYTGNGTNQVIDCGFISGSNFIMIRRASGVGDWMFFDTTRGINSPSWEDKKLTLNSTAAEVSNINGVYTYALGFGVAQDAATDTNILNQSYIFLAIA